MKNIAIVSVLAASAAQAYIVPPRVAQLDFEQGLDKRQILASITNSKGKSLKLAQQHIGS
jgi:hypothetical protein